MNPNNPNPKFCEKIEVKKKFRVLELFSGTASFSNVAKERGHKVFTIDFDKQFNPDLCIDMLDFKISMLPEEFRHPDIIWASPPCTCFSVASIGTHWKGGKKAYIPKTKQAEKSMQLVIKTLEIIAKLNPKFWIIENPRGVLRKLSITPNENLQTITYCQYGDTRMKPTDIWTNLNWKGKRCNNGDKCHEPAPRGSKTGTQGLKNAKLRSIVPRELCLEIIKHCEVSK
jgi:hypothetical protein